MIQKISNDFIIPKFEDVAADIFDERYTHYWFPGGRSSTKSSFISIMIVMGIINDSQANAICFRKYGNNLQDSCFNQILWAINILGVKDFFGSTTHPLKITYLPTGQIIYFRGMDDPDKSKSIKPVTGYLKIAWLEELAEYAGKREVRKVLQSVIRGGKKFTVFYSYNPPPEPNNWVNKERRIERKDKLVTTSTYLDVPVEWLGQQSIIEAEELKKEDELAYRHEYLAEEVGTGLNVFTNIKSRKITTEEIKKFDNICEGIDWGYSVDPFVWLKLHYDRKYKRLYIFDEIYQVGLSNDDAIEKVVKRHTKSTEIIADSEEPKSIDDFENSGLPIRGARKGPGSVNYGIKRLQGLREIIIDSERCPNAYEEFIEYAYDQNRDGTTKSKYPDKNNHTIDAARYALEDEFTY